ncbi:MAG: 23S rRNA (adenine(2503)-C(2))-methyltransferase RlmN [Anaerolineales bacterium]|jgi:23S rRNA (adenine2503-C2)-methyltransferase
MKLVYDLTLSELVSLMIEWNEPVYRARQIWQGLYRQYWNSPAKFTNIPTSLRTRLAETLEFNVLTLVTTLTSSDGQTVKSLFKLSDGKSIEAVLMRYKKRNTLCISSQAGCAMGCVFCATGQMGFKRHLSSGEIVAQVMYYARQLYEENTAVTNVVLMGMGEPFHNYENTLAAIDRLNDPQGYNLGARRFTISTVGLIPAIRRFATEKRQINLAISLHAADDDLRTSMLPVNKRYPIDELLAACREYIAVTGRRITFEWALINGVNDTPDQAILLAKKLKGLLGHVNAILLNPTLGYSGQATSHERAEKFRQILEEHGIPCTIRLRRGIDIQAGCGQLVSRI